MRYLLITLIFLLLSCGYPDIDNVPDFKDLELSEEEILDYCSSINTSKKIFKLLFILNIRPCSNSFVD